MSMHKYCEECGSKIKRDTRYCPECGALQEPQENETNSLQRKTPIKISKSKQITLVILALAIIGLNLYLFTPNSLDKLELPESIPFINDKTN